ncbi:MAG: hypothetical protein V1838_01215 [Patescibacteria group bacterium]
MEKEQEKNKRHLGRKVQKTGRRFTIGVTFPLVLIIMGIMIFPLGIILWVAAILLFIKVFKGKKKDRQHDG